MTRQPPCLTQADLMRLMRNDFASFIAASFDELNPGTTYLHNWHIDVIADRLTQFADGKLTRLVIMLPPRSLKSHCASVSLVAWLLGRDPTKRIICASYSQDLADFHARSCLKLMQSDLYRRLFPATQLSASRRAVAEFFTTQEGMRLATSVGGTLTGKGGDYVIIDDPLKPEDALSDTLRNNANEWYDGTVISRLNNKATGGVLIIMQRLHEDDLVGHVLQQHGWEVLRLPAIAEEDEEYLIDTPIGSRTCKRKAGEALHPERETLETLAQIRAAQGEYHFAAQYQQLPAPRGGAMLKLDWIRYYDTHEKPESFDHVVQSWDTAAKVTELADYSVCTTWGIKDKIVYLLDVYRKKVDFPDLRKMAIMLAERYCPQYVLVEDKSSGTQLIQGLPDNGNWMVKACKPEGDKKVRFGPLTCLFENEKVLLPRRAPWLDSYVYELTTFPTSRYKDQVDSTTQALAWIKLNAFEPGIIGYYQDLVERRQRGEE
ncbi:phage terminase large subunit [Ralstonia pickettii]|uniref:Phage terminase large subunit n=1 Tax=Ralstonia pickettii TaxID=329 RepID=A0A7X2HLU8_RALPI|nr:phage terminase large subunit [Ralstonia pickettii]MRS98903.1 phage terminase large subunit [Ralstonia pickettii]